MRLSAPYLPMIVQQARSRIRRIFHHQRLNISSQSNYMGPRMSGGVQIKNEEMDNDELGFDSVGLPPNRFRGFLPTGEPIGQLPNSNEQGNSYQPDVDLICRKNPAVGRLGLPRAWLERYFKEIGPRPRNAPNRGKSWELHQIFRLLLGYQDYQTMAM